MKIRTRIAPSPTGKDVHVGSVATALMNFAWAKKHNGQFIVRIEDTDQDRSTQEYTQAILDGFSWTGITFDEPILIQSTRKKVHQQLAQELVASGKAYKCYCTPQDLDDRLGSNAQGSDGEYRLYDRHCLHRHEAGITEDSSKPYVIRFKVPDHDTRELNMGLHFNDIIRDEVTFIREQFDDFIILRSDGLPMYNFAVVADDAYMSITHIIRGEDHLVNTPKQIWLYRACGWSVPLFGHVPLILGPTGQKLSKRDAATSVVDYKKNGFLPEALCNYLVRLGWSHGDQEIFSREEMIEHFSLKAIGKKGSMFDMTKLLWLNSVYIKRLTPAQIIERIFADMNVNLSQRYSTWSIDVLQKGIALFIDRVHTLKDFIEELDTLYQQPQLDQHTVEQLMTASGLTQQQLVAFLNDFVTYSGEHTKESYMQHVKQTCNTHVTTLKAVAHLLRYALVGKTESIGIGDCIVMIGWNESCNRLKKFIGKNF